MVAERTYRLGVGMLSVSVTRSEHYTIDELLTVAQRRNPKRPFLFVSKVLGRHIPVRPATHRAMLDTLAAKIPDGLPMPMLVMGMAETAVGLGAGIHQQLQQRYPGAVYLSSTRHPVVDGTLFCEFLEEHSHATRHLIHIPQITGGREQLLNTQTLVLVDDEATTGKTFANLVTAIRAAGLTQLKEIVLVTMTDWSANGAHDLTVQRLPAEIGCQSVSLSQGQWSWQPAADAATLEMPQVDVSRAGSVTILPQPRSCRAGYIDPCEPLPEPTVAPGERILVMGSGEFVWQPFLLAEALERQGCNVQFSATTRSPIAVGAGIEHALAFQDNYGLSIQMYAYNVVPDYYDRIILCSETAASSWDTRLRNALPHLEILTA